jgi:hypothetical protein
MRIARWAVWVVVFVGVCGVGPATRPAVGQHVPFTNNRCIPKGGVGVIRPTLYIDLKSANNELLMKDGSRWAGRSRDAREMAIFFKGKVWTQENLPKEFQLGDAIVVSFEGSKVMFFDFARMSGGYYDRSIYKDQS